MRRFETGTGRDRRYWEVEADGRFLQLRWGKGDGRPQQSRKLMKTPRDAREEAARRVAAKQRDGWVEVDLASETASLDMTPHVHWDPQSQRRVLPFARRPRRTPPRDAEGPWRKLVKAVHRQRHRLDQATGNDRAIAQLRDAVAELETPPTDPIALGSLAALAPDKAWLDLWLALGGEALALRALVHSERLQVGGGSRPYVTTVEPVIVPTLTSPWRALRKHLLAASEEAYAEALDAARQLRQGAPLGLRCAISTVFPAESELCDPDLAEALAAGPERHHLVLLGCTTDPGAAAALIAAVGGRLPPWDLLPTYFDTLLARMGPAALAPLEAVRARREIPEVVETIARIRSPEAAESLVASLDLMPDAAAAGLHAMPVYAVPALRRARSDRAQAVLAELLDRHPQLGEVDRQAQAATEDLHPDFLAVPEGVVPPPWLRVPRLPRSMLTSGEALPPQAVGAMVRQLVHCDLQTPPPGVRTWRAQTTGLADLAEALLAAWQEAGLPREGRWVLGAQVHLADPSTPRRLARRLLQWPRAGHAREAALAVDALAHIRLSEAMMQLFALRQQRQTRAVSERAALHIEALAKQANMPLAELEERLVPDLGLDDRGGLDLDFGPRRFRVTFDERLQPVLLDAEGQPVPRFPSARKSDDAALARQAKQTWTALKADVKTLAKAQLTRFETAMVEGQSWDTRDFLDHVVGHRLVAHLARRLVWRSGDQTFRVDESGELVDADEEPFTPGPKVDLPHPLDLPALSREAWSEILGDYQILQPFDQLGRRFPTLPTAPSRQLALPDDHSLSTGRVLGLTRKGWQREMHTDEDRRLPVFSTLTRELRGVRIRLELDGWVNLEHIDAEARLPVCELRASRDWSEHPVVTAEVLRDLGVV
ncbi:MAG: DUF4132 domain-containing protein [Deltaproteobacteria bacterium]|nr:MAG: DUF4132 domain-containing protein [Deltaproteobacteria bacterium]